jgi:hypothetical protein
MATAALIVAFVSVGVAIASAAVAGFSAYYAKGQLEQAKNANALLTAIELFREFRGMREARRVAFAVLPSGASPMDQIRGDVIDLMHLLDNLGMLVSERLVSAELVAGYMGDSVIALWDKLGPSIEADRKRRREAGESDAFQEYFEYLARTMRDVDPAKVRAKLRR